MSKSSKQIAQEMLKMSTTPQDRKEVVNACLFVLKSLTEGSSETSSKMGKIAGGAGACVNVKPSFDPYLFG